MNELDLRLYELLGDKDLSFGCVVEITDYGYGDCFSSFNKVTVLSKSSNDYVPNWISFEYYQNIEPTSANDAKIKGRYDGIGWKIIGHEPTIADLHRWMNGNWNTNLQKSWLQGENRIECVDTRIEFISGGIDNGLIVIPYDSSKSLLSQSDETKKAIIQLIESHA